LRRQWASIRGTDGTPPLSHFEGVATASSTRKPWKFTENCISIYFEGGLAESIEYAHFPDGYWLNIARLRTASPVLVHELPDEIADRIEEHEPRYVLVEASEDGLEAASTANAIAKALGYENGLEDALYHRRRSV
jgi:hypothetical protein